MTDPATTDFAGIFQGDISVSDICSLRRKVFSSREARKAFKDYVSTIEVKSSLSDKEKAALAICYCIEGRYDRGMELAKEHKSNDVVQFVGCRCKLSSGKASEAATGLKTLAPKLKNGEAQAALVEALRRTGDLDAARAALKDGLDKYGNNALLLTEAGILADMKCDYNLALDYYMKACKADPECAEALFRLGYISDLRGDNDGALEYYQRCAQVKPVRSRALVNLGLLYEEIGRQSEAVRCFQLVYNRYPMDKRTRLYLRDAIASEDMFFDEEQQKKRERRNKILETPISDFELSVRSRNCLEKMNVTTLGDLTRISEPDLLSFKNFGETSLNEIKQMLGSKGLRLGQALEGDDKSGKLKPIKRKTIDRAKVITRPVDDLGLSVRSQHCMQLLGVKTIGDLCAKSERELMQAKNFGQTSLVEVRKKLAALSLTLAD
jgi:DNA-directed RNA polymerase subunit alpha